MFSDKITYQPVATDDDGSDSQMRSVKDKLRRRKTSYFVLFLLLVVAVYVVISLVMSNDSTFSISFPASHISDEIITEINQTLQDSQEVGVESEAVGLADTTSTEKDYQTTIAPEISSSLPPETTGDSGIYTTPKYESSTRSADGLACHIPKLDPFAKEIKHLVVKPDFVNCTDKIPLLFNSTFNRTVVPVGDIKERLDVQSCCFQTVERAPGKDDDAYLISDTCTPLSLDQPTQLPENEQEYILLYCDVFNSSTASSSTSSQKPETYSKYVDAHAFVPRKEKVEKRILEYYQKLSEAKQSGADVLLEHERLNVVVLGIDAVSHMNMRRTFSKSYSFLMNELSAVEMQGYNKMGDNTLPNIGAVLTGLNESEVKLCEKNRAFDACPFVWKSYQENGFRTAFSEDSPWMGIFNYLKNGFESPPTDYYARPFTKAAEDYIGSHKELNAKLCYGPRLSFQVLMNLVQKMAFSMGKKQRYLQFIWATSLTHDFLNEGNLGDDHLLSTLEWLQFENYLNHTMLLVMSDHGIRWGEIRDFHQGLLEERLPFLYFVAPNWFKERYSNAFENLKSNQQRLTSPFDLHATLVDLLDLRNITPSRVTEREKELQILEDQGIVPRSISLFLPIPRSRTCETSNIPEHYCTCLVNESHAAKTNHPIVKQVANYALYVINSLVSSQARCSYLGLESVLHAYVSGNRFKRTYQVTFRTIPGNATYEASVIKNQTGFWGISGKISRTNLYGNQSHCTDVKDLKLYCYCTDLLTG